MFDPDAVPSLPYDLIEILSYAALPLTRERPGHISIYTVADLQQEIADTEAKLAAHLQMPVEAFQQEAETKTAQARKWAEDAVSQSQDELDMLELWQRTFMPQIQTPALREVASPALDQRVQSQKDTLANNKAKLAALTPTTAQQLWDAYKNMWEGRIASYKAEIERIAQTEAENAAYRATAEAIETELRCLRLRWRDTLS